MVTDRSSRHQIAALGLASVITSRKYDYVLGGKDNFAIDRETAEAALRSLPTLRAGVRENREIVLAADSAYGPSTRDAVISWQRRAHIGVDGIVGPQTRASLGL